MDEVFAEIPKGKTEVVKIGLNTFNGHQLASVRVWTTRDPDNPRPTTKGLTVQVTMLPEIIEGLQKAEAAARAAGLLE